MEGIEIGGEKGHVEEVVRDPIFIAIYNKFRWKMIPNCTGRYTCRDHKAVSQLTPTNLILAAGVDEATVLNLKQYFVTFDKGQKDPIYVVPVADDGLTGLITYVKRRDGEEGLCFVHTLNSASGFQRKLEAISVVLSDEDLLDAAKKLEVGIFLIDQFLSKDDAENAFQVLNDGIPWELKPKMYGEELSQHAYHHIRNKSSAKRALKSTGLSQLERLCAKIEKEFDGKVSDVYCNRFEDPTHHIAYHTDTFGRHIMVLSLGSRRSVNFRHKHTKEVTEVRPNAGDLYFMPLRVNDSYEHCVCSAKEESTGDGNDTRISFVFFFDTPKYAKEYKIGTVDKIRGFFEGILAG